MVSLENAKSPVLGTVSKSVLQDEIEIRIPKNSNKENGRILNRFFVKIGKKYFDN
jgi:hypothetical protein